MQNLQPIMSTSSSKYLGVTLHHRRPQTVGGFKKCSEEQGQTHEIAATGIVKMFAISAGDHFTFSFFGFARFIATLDDEKR